MCFSVFVCDSVLVLFWVCLCLCVSEFVVLVMFAFWQVWGFVSLRVCGVVGLWV